MNTTLLLDEHADIEALRRTLTTMGVWATPLSAHATADAPPTLGLYLEAHSAAVSESALAALPGVRAILAPASAHPMLDLSRGKAQRLGVNAAGEVVSVGRGAPALLIAGPCSAESEQTAWGAAVMAASVGARVLRGGAFKPRTSPYAYRGAGDLALQWLRAAATAHGLLLVSEATGEAQAEAVAAHVDIIQVGSRSMASYGLLSVVGQLGKPVLLKRGQSATLEEFRLAAEHLLAAGASAVVLCERGITGHDGETRNVLDLGAVALLSAIDGLAVVVDPSHAAGRRDLVLPLAAAAIAAGAHGIIVEAHPDVASARSDGPQALDADNLGALARAMGLRPGGVS